MQLVSIHLTMSGGFDPIFSRKLTSGSEPDHLSQRSQIDAESLVAAFRKRWITKMVVERIAIDHPYITHETDSVIFPICTQEHSMCISQGSTESQGLFDSV